MAPGFGLTSDWKGWKQMNKSLTLLAVMLTVMLCVQAAWAQRGTGQQQGVARQVDKPPVETIVGSLKEIKTDPCGQATGRSPVGTHLILQGDTKTYNVHLGPASEVVDVVGMVRVGDKIEARVFRTPRLPEDQYVAVSVKLGEKEIALRDDSLRPKWAGGGRRGPGPQAARGGGRGAAGRGGRRLAFSRVLRQSSELDLSSEQVDKIEAILAKAESQIREILTEQQLNALNSQPRGRQGRGRGPR
jgi:hypothetical protein